MNLYRLKMHLKNIKPIKKTYDILMKSNEKAKHDANRTYNFTIESYNVIDDVEKVLEDYAPLQGRYFLDFGCLLGVIRSGKLIKWDKDVDYGIIIDDHFTWNNLEKYLTAKGYQKKKQFRFNDTITEQNYEKNGVGIDIFAHYLKDNSSLFYSYYRKNKYIYNNRYEMHVMQFYTTLLNNTRVYQGEKVRVHIPNNVEDYLADIYTSQWRVPNPNWVPGSGPTCEKLGDEFIAYLEEF